MIKEDINGNTMFQIPEDIEQEDYPNSHNMSVEESKA